MLPNILQSKLCIDRKIQMVCLLSCAICFALKVIKCDLDIGHFFSDEKNAQLPPKLRRIIPGDVLELNEAMEVS